ncbi:hypothetical protein NP603_01925 [Methylomonas sp. SURF-1]|uniref:Uncharacterized protein n=1 Tax=Methylomonas aurea TaxID=2952224 RepID=A0ABT1UDT1_9GAMM|nr:hypothetical protein [Methylomonas sp. SURF-1]MCQ8179855.1 hypothetical protein [Methylomonas sp. SURF-1]
MLILVSHKFAASGAIYYVKGKITIHLARIVDTRNGIFWGSFWARGYFFYRPGVGIKR